MARIRLPVVALLLGLAAAEAARAGDGIPTACEPVEEPAPSAPPAPHAGLTALERARFDAGERAFRRVETPASGLGPVFNAESCVACHGQPSAGGSSRTAVTRFARADGAFDPLPARGGPVLQKHGLCGDACVVPGEAVPAEATIVTLRDTQPLFGLGFLDAVPEAQIAARADPDDRDGDGISGRPQLIAGRVGRFGWKAQVPTLEEFASLASLNEIGITSPALPAEVGPRGKRSSATTYPIPRTTAHTCVRSPTSWCSSRRRRGVRRRRRAAAAAPSSAVSAAATAT
jgi:CxxC motif-containing protein (DUF1111 family)